MTDFDKVPLPDYTRAEDTINSVTHALGIPLTFAVTFMFLHQQNFQAKGTTLAAIIIYGISMFILYFGSAYYHGLKPSRIKKVARVLDHSNIFIMIAGSLTGYYLVAVINYASTLAIVLTVVSWVAAIVGIVLTVWDQERFKKVQMVMYLALGWSAIAASFPLIKQGGEIGKQFFIYIVIGGLLYSVGAALYGVGKKIRYVHAVFHIFVLAATFVQSVGIYKYIDALSK